MVTSRAAILHDCHEPRTVWVVSRGRRIREAREHAGLTQQQLAEALGVGTQSIWRWEHDKPIRGENLAALAKRLRVSMDWLQMGRGPGPGEEQYLERDDDPLLRHPSLARAIELVGHVYSAEVIEELKSWAGLGGDAPDTVEGWLVEAKRISEALAKRG